MTPEIAEQTVLVVDDTPANLALAVNFLEEHDFKVLVAQGGEEAVKRAQLIIPDLILLDVMMPGINGFETCRRLKAIDLTREIPVIFMTALADLHDKVAGFAAGGVDYLTKPFQVEELLARVKTHLALQAIKRQLAAQNTQLRQESAVRIQAEENLRGIVAEQQTILENASVGIAFLKNRRIVRCNHTFATMFGYRIDELIGSSTRSLHVSEEAFQNLGKHISAAIEVGKTHAIDIRLRRRDDSFFWAESIVTAVDPSDLSSGAIWLAHDIDARKRAESLRAEQGRALEMIASGSPLEQVLDSITQLLESQSEGAMGSIQLLDDDGLHLRHVSTGRLPEAYARAINGIAIGPRAASFGTAVYRREPVAVANIQDNPLWADYRELVAPFGFTTVWSWPILSREGQVLGALSLYGAQGREPTKPDIQLVEMALRIASIAVEHKRAEERIKYMAHHDILTGLPNRTLLKDRLDQAILHGQRYARFVTIVFIDLDNFKLINDSLGHNVGDELLKIIARRMEQCIRRADTVVRLGGDEFVIILFDQPTQTETIAGVIQKIMDTVSQRTMVATHQIDITCSMGISTFPHDGNDTNTLLMNADAAMYLAKEQGRNNFQFFTPALNARIRDRLVMQEGLRNAIARNEFLLLYQPQVDLQTHRIIGVEALIRWQHPQLGLITPEHFIALAEETGLIVPIGDWVLRTACKQNKDWQLRGFPPSTVSVNVSARQFREKNLIARVTHALQESKLEARYLELELTESLIMQDIGQAIATMNQLNQMGVGLSIDDFGTGYSSLSALKNFPIMRLKIDKSFVRDIHTDPADAAIAKAVITLGHQLNLKVIAEGVETDDQLRFLRNNLCDEMQGYHFSKPVSPQELEKLLSVGTKTVL